eukprot:SAG11_NODE_2077_length_3856_cov_2.082246_1_plen_82_part_00
MKTATSGANGDVAPNSLPRSGIVAVTVGVGADDIGKARVAERRREIERRAMFVRCRGVGGSSCMCTRRPRRGRGPAGHGSL